MATFCRVPEIQPQHLVLNSSLTVLAQDKKVLQQVESGPGQESSSQVQLGTFHSSCFFHPSPVLFVNCHCPSGENLMLPPRMGTNK